MALQCILYPVLSASSLLSQFLTRDFKLLRDAFQIDANTHKQVLNEASNESNYVLCLLLQQIQNLDKDAIYNINNFQVILIYNSLPFLNFLNRISLNLQFGNKKQLKN